MTTTTGDTNLTRRRLIGAALAVGVAAPIGLAGRASAAPAAPGPVRLTLPPPTGPYPVGTVALHLVDRSRPDPLAGPGRHRELMVGVVPGPGRRAATAGAVAAGRRDAGAAGVRRVRRRRRGGAAHGRPRGRPGAAHDRTTARRRVLARRARPPGRSHHRGAGAGQPRVRGGHGGPHVRRVQRVPRRPAHRPDHRRRALVGRSRTSPGTSRSSSTASRTSPPGATPTPNTGGCQPACAARSTRAASACSAGRKVARRRPSSCATTHASGPA